jgi:2-polyprenyl-3-methyl-5-hydroxy-6-metoxy-1,4-benzoquinol methylase
MEHKKTLLQPLVLYKYSKSLQRKAFVLIDSLFTGFWLGVLSEQSLHKIDELYYNDDKSYRNDKYNLQGLWEWEKKAIELFYGNCKNLMLLGAGGGREIYGLEQWNYQIEAYECNPELLDYANKFLRKEGISVEVKSIERNECPTTGNLYDGAIIGWGSYMLIQGRKQRISFLSKLHQQLKPNSPVLISFYTADENKRSLMIASKTANVFRLILQRRLTDVGDYLFPNYVHYFTKEQIASEFAESGFDLMFYSENPYGHAVGLTRNN